MYSILKILWQLHHMQNKAQSPSPVLLSPSLPLSPTFHPPCQSHVSGLWYLKSLGAFALTAHSPNWQSRASQQPTSLPPCHLFLNLCIPSKLVLTSLAGKPMGAMADWAGWSGPSGALAIQWHGLCSLLFSQSEFCHVISKMMSWS